MSRDPYKYFRLEAEELLAALSRSLLALDNDQPAPADIVGLLRAMHTLKGAARVVRQGRVADLCHRAETTLAAFRGADLVPRAVVAELLRVVDDIEGALRELPGGDAAAQPARTAKAPTAPRVLRIELNELDRLLERAAAARVQLANIERATGRLDAIADDLGGASEAFSAGRPPAQGALRALVERTEGHIATVRRLTTRAIEQAERDLTEAQELGRGLRLVAVESIFPALERAVHDSAISLGKEVDLRTSGAEVRVDAHVLDRLRDVLLHLVRNAVAHGIESSEVRRAAGKPARGEVRIDFERRGQMARVICADDGGGVDLAAVRRAVVARGMLAPAAAEALERAAALRLIFAGLSTADTVTPIAGRGLGLGVVAEITRRLGARIEAESEPGRGMRIAIEVPLSLAAATVLEVEAGGMRAALPLATVATVVRVPAERSRPTGVTPVFVHDGEELPFVPLAQLFGTAQLRPEPRPEPRPKPRRSEAVVIVASDRVRFALGCDRAIGTCDLVTRPLPALLGTVPGVAGAALDPAGEPLVILDPRSLLEQAAALPDEPTLARPPPHILVIDDSFTTRLIAQGILEAAGYRVDTAGSAEEALARAGVHPYSLFLVDIELPGMDGFSFIASTRADPALQGVPTIIISSRDSPADRRRGAEAGAAAYIVKSEFDEPNLLGRIEAVIPG
jgi:two-component system, chemotaxis family, sensor kinase CheA